MSAKRDIVDIIRALAAGSTVPWSDLEPADESTRAILQELEIVSRVAQTHGTLREDNSNPERGPSSDDPSAGHTWGPLTLLERVGVGAYGEVYRAWDTRLDREVALKLLYPDGIDSGDGTTIEEGRSLARVRHPNVVTVYGADRINGRIGIWTEFIDGQTLAQSLQEHGPYEPEEACAIAVEVCHGLAAVHQAGLVHGDIKSTNVMRQDDGRVILMDFGASHHPDSRRGPSVAGTPTYMAPEVLGGGRHTMQSDVYSVGVLLHHLLTNTYPVTGRTLGDLRDAHQRHEPRALDRAAGKVPRRLATVLERALNPDATARYASAEAMASAIADANRTPRPSGVRRWWAAAAVLIAVAVAAAGLTIWFRSAGAPTAQARLNFAPRDYVLITKFDNRTGDAVFDGAVEYALQRELSASAVVALLPEERVGDALALMKQARETVVTRELGRDVALRDGHVKALLAGRVERFGTNYVITAQLIDPSNDAVVATMGESADGQNEVVAALQRQAKRVRIELGEKLRVMRGADPRVEQAATTSLKAFQLYNQSYRLGGQGEWPAALEIAKRVVQVDPQFASGWIWLAWAVSNTRSDPDPGRSTIREYATRAVQLSQNGPEWERHWIEGSYYTLMRQRAAAIPHFEALLALRPDHYWALNNLIGHIAGLHRPGDYGKYLALLQLRGRLVPNDPYSLAEAALAAARESQSLDTAKPFLDQLSALRRPDQATAADATFAFDFASTHVSWLLGDLRGTLDHVNAMATRLDRYPANRQVEAVTGILNFYASLGRMTDARRFALSLVNGPNAAQAKRAVARESGDLATVRRLIGSANRPANRYIHGPDYVQIGMIDAAREYAKGHAPNFDPGQAEVTIGLLALHDHDATRGVAHLERGVELLSSDNHPTYWGACESLADLLWQAGRRNEAIDRLTECSANDFKSIALWAPLGPARARLNLHLARLHRLTGNLAAAIDLESRVRERLALADANYPLLKQLESR